MAKSKVFLDSSVILAALLSSRGGSFYILTQLKNKFAFQINEYVLDEVLEVINKKFNRRKNMYDNLFILLGGAKVMVLPNSSVRSIKSLFKIINKKDAPILESAVSNSDYLVTLDNDFLLNEEVVTFAHDSGISIMTPGEFIKL